MGGWQAAQKKEFFRVIIGPFSLDTTPPRKLVGKGWDRARRKLCRYILLLSLSIAGFLSFFLFIQRVHYMTLHCITIRQGRSPSLFWCTEDKGADKKVRWLLHLYIHNFFFLSFWYFLASGKCWMFYLHISAVHLEPCITFQPHPGQWCVCTYALPHVRSRGACE